MIKSLSVTVRHIWWYCAQLFCLLGCHGALFGRQLTVFWDNLSVTSSWLLDHWRQNR